MSAGIGSRPMVAAMHCRDRGTVKLRVDRKVEWDRANSSRGRCRLYPPEHENPRQRARKKKYAGGWRLQLMAVSRLVDRQPALYTSLAKTGVPSCRLSCSGG